MNDVKTFLVLCAVGLTNGCAMFSTADVVEPSDVTLEEALKSVGAGMYEMKKAQQNMSTGLIPSSVEVTFTVAASTSKTGSATLSISNSLAAPPTSQTQSLGATATTSSTANRGNTITVKFVNLLTIPKDTLAHEKSADELGKIILIPAAGGWTYFGSPEVQKALESQILINPTQSPTKGANK